MWFGLNIVGIFLGILNSFRRLCLRGNRLDSCSLGRLFIGNFLGSRGGWSSRNRKRIFVSILGSFRSRRLGNSLFNIYNRLIGLICLVLGYRILELFSLCRLRICRGIKHIFLCLLYRRNSHLYIHNYLNWICFPYFDNL